MNSATQIEFDIIGENTWITVVGRKNAEKAFLEAALLDDTVALTYVNPPDPLRPVPVMETEKHWKKYHMGVSPFEVWAVEQHLAKLRLERGIVNRAA